PLSRLSPDQPVARRLVRRAVFFYEGQSGTLGGLRPSLHEPRRVARGGRLRQPAGQQQPAYGDFSHDRPSFAGSIIAARRRAYHAAPVKLSCQESLSPGAPSSPAPTPRSPALSRFSPPEAERPECRRPARRSPASRRKGWMV